MLLGLSGKTDDEGRSDGESRDPGTHPADQPLDVTAVGLALH